MGLDHGTPLFPLPPLPPPTSPYPRNSGAAYLERTRASSREGIVPNRSRYSLYSNDLIGSRYIFRPLLYQNMNPVQVTDDDTIAAETVFAANQLHLTTFSPQRTAASTTGCARLSDSSAIPASPSTGASNSFRRTRTVLPPER